MSEPAARGAIDTVRALVPAGQRARRGTVRRGDPLLVRGWALEPAGRAAFDALEIGFGNGAAFDAVVGLARPDVVAAFGLPADVAAGFTAVVATGDLPPGPLVAEVRGRMAGGPALLVGRFAVTLLGPARALDLTPGLPSARVVVDPPVVDRDGAGPVLVVAGWALDGRDRPARQVVVTVGRFGAEAVAGYPRPDVVAALGLGPPAEPCGFRLRVPCDELDGTAQVAAHVDDAQGVRWSSAPVPLPADFTLAPLGGAPARGAIDDVRVLDARNVGGDRLRAVRVRAGDRLVLSGWAAHDGVPDGELVAILDGIAQHPIAERVERPDVVQASLGPAKAGFLATIPIRGLPAGLHVIEIFVRRADGTLLATAARTTVEVVG